MPDPGYGIRLQRNHRTVSPAVMEWYQHHFEPSTFDGRFQLGYRKSGERGIWPLFTGDRDRLETFLEFMHVSGRQDYYITANSFSGVERKANSLFGLHNIVLDVDSHGQDGVDGESATSDQEQLEELISRVTWDLFDSGDVPSPSSIICTGRGIQMWWHITPISIKCGTWYREIQQTLAAALRQCLSEYPSLFDFQLDGGASQNMAGYFRLPGTINTHTFSMSEICYFVPVTHSTFDLIKWAKAWKQDNPAALSERPPTADFSGKYTTADIYILKDFFTIGFFRVKQMIQLRLLRDNDVGDETRNNMCFIVYNAMLPVVGHDKAWDKLLAFNKGFKQPMSERELHQTIDTAHRKNGYRYRNETIIEFLGITPQEQEAIGLYPPTKPFTPLTRFSKNPSRDVARRAVKEDRNARIQALQAAGYSKSKIAEELGISRATVGAVLGPAPLRNEMTQAFELFEAGMTNASVEDRLGISRSTAKRYRKKWKQLTEGPVA